MGVADGHRVSDDMSRCGIIPGAARRSTKAETVSLVATKIRRRPARKAKAAPPFVIEVMPDDEEGRFELLMVQIGKALHRMQKETIFVTWRNGLEVRCTVEFQRTGKA